MMMQCPGFLKEVQALLHNTKTVVLGFFRKSGWVLSFQESSCIFFIDVPEGQCFSSVSLNVPASCRTTFFARSRITPRANLTISCSGVLRKDGPRSCVCGVNAKQTCLAHARGQLSSLLFHKVAHCTRFHSRSHARNPSALGHSGSFLNYHRDNCGQLSYKNSGHSNGQWGHLGL